MANQPAKLDLSIPFSMTFDFSSSDEQEILQYLQNNGYQLIAYRGATGSAQVTAGLPTWFTIPFLNIFGIFRVSYTPIYKIYVFNQAEVAANTIIEMQALSSETELGSAFNFTQSGQFTSNGTAPRGTITLTNLRPAGTPNVTVGLAGLVNSPSGSQYLPFCAFTLTPQGSITMAPTETVAMMAAQVDLQSGNVQANASAPGCSFTFDSSNLAYDLMIQDSTYTITGAPGAAPVTPMSSGQALSFLNNSAPPLRVSAGRS